MFCLGGFGVNCWRMSAISQPELGIVFPIGNSVVVMGCNCVIMLYYSMVVQSLGLENSSQYRTICLCFFFFFILGDMTART